MSLIVDVLKANKRLEQINFTIFIVGSRKIRADENSEWHILAPNLTIYGFDADEDACEQANQELAEQNIDWVEKHIPLALSDTEGEKTLYATKALMCSSLYEPNSSFLDRFYQINNLVALDFTVELPTVTLDNFCESENIQELDFIHIDVQGADLDVLRGGNRILQTNILAINIEVEFATLYKNQPLFSDVDIFLRTLGFQLFNINTGAGMARCPRAISPLIPNRGGQLLWGDALYLRDPIAENAPPITQNPEKVLKLACIADVLGYVDYSLELLHYLTLNYGDDPAYNFAPDIVQALKQFPDLLEHGLENLPIVSSLNSYL